MSSLEIQGNASGTGTTTLQAANTSSSTTFTLPGTDGSSGQALTTNGSGALNFATVGYINIPQSGAAKTGSYTLATGDVGEFIQVSTGGSIVIPDATFSVGDAVVIFNNTSGSITITCTITTAYIGGTDTDKASVSLATRGVCNILFISGTVCVITGNVS
jgi:hypothetical protein